MSFRMEQSEAEFQAAVTTLAELQGWGWMHVRGRQQVSGYFRTPVAGPLGPGWPDLVMVKGDRLLFVELKAQRGVMRQAQRDVLLTLSFIPGAEVFVWRPSDWPLIIEVLQGERGIEGELREKADAR